MQTGLVISSNVKKWPNKQFNLNLYLNLPVQTKVLNIDFDKNGLGIYHQTTKSKCTESRPTLNIKVSLGVNTECVTNNLSDVTSTYLLA